MSHRKRSVALTVIIAVMVALTVGSILYIVAQSRAAAERNAQLDAQNRLLLQELRRSQVKNKKELDKKVDIILSALKCIALIPDDKRTNRTNQICINKAKVASDIRSERGENEPQPLNGGSKPPTGSTTNPSPSGGTRPPQPSSPPEEPSEPDNDGIIINAPDFIPLVPDEIHIPSPR